MDLIYIAIGGLCGFLIGSLTRRRPPWIMVAFIATAALLTLAWNERQWFLQ